MRRSLAIAALLAAFVALIASASPVGKAALTACTSTDGGVDSYLPTATISCSRPILINTALHRTERLSTNALGSLDFHTSYFPQCKQLHSSLDIVWPSSTVAIQHLKGTTWCRDAKTKKKIWLTLGQKIRVHLDGTVIGLEVIGQDSIIQVAEGSATVVVAGQRAGGVKVGKGFQLTVAAGRGQPKLSTMTPTLEDQLAITELNFGVYDTAPSIAPAFFHANGETQAVVIAANIDIANQAGKQLGHVNSNPFTSSQILNNPSLILDQLKRLGAHTIVTAGDPAALAPVWQILRQKLKLSPAIRVVYMPGIGG